MQGLSEFFSEVVSLKLGGEINEESSEYLSVQFNLKLVGF